MNDINSHKQLLSVLGRKPPKPTLREYEAEVARGVGAAPYGPNPPMTQREIQQMADNYHKAYETPKKPKPPPVAKTPPKPKPKPRAPIIKPGKPMP